VQQSGELVEPNEHSEFWHHEIIDSTGKVFIGVLYENGAVETAYTMWDSVDTIERFEARPILHHYSGRVTRTLHSNRDTNELFCERSHRNSCDTEIYRVRSSELLEWFLGITEHDLLELPNTGHVCISLPAELREQIGQVTAAEHQSLNEWVVSRLSEAAQDESSSSGN
jgi:hypothetical protein